MRVDPRHPLSLVTWGSTSGSPPWAPSPASCGAGRWADRVVRRTAPEVGGWPWSFASFGVRLGGSSASSAKPTDEPIQPGSVAGVSAGRAQDPLTRALVDSSRTKVKITRVRGGPRPPLQQTVHEGTHTSWSARTSKSPKFASSAAGRWSSPTRPISGTPKSSGCGLPL